MGSKAKTRFSFQVNGVDKEVLSIRERTNGTLQILCQAGRNLEDGPHDRVIAEDHYTVHPQNEGSGVTIKRTTVTEDGLLIEQATFVRVIDGSMASPIYAKVSQDLGPETYNLPRRRKDRIVPMGGMDASAETLIFSVIVASRDWPMDQIKLPPLRLVWADFRLFRVGVVCGMVGLRSSPFGRYSHLLTSTPRVNGGDFAQARPDEALMTPSSAAMFMRILIEGTVRAHLFRLASLMEEDVAEVLRQMGSAYSLVR